jgi:PhoH-like ATPase
MSRKTFILDTNVLLFDPLAVRKLGDNDIIIPITVIEEIDRFKKDLNENGRNARQISRFLDEVRRKGNLLDGVDIDNGATIYVDMPEDRTPVPGIQGDKADNLIMSIALKHKEIDSRKDVIFITKDTNLRIKADILGLRAVDYEPNQKKIEDLYSGKRFVNCSKKEIDKFYKEKSINIKDLKNVTDILPNEYVILKDSSNKSHTALARYDFKKQRLVGLVRGAEEGIWGIKPKNVEQTFAMDMLLNDDIRLVCLAGKAGTGKTLLALCAGLSLTIDLGSYTRLLVSRPIFPLGKDIGYLPGDVEEKLNPWMAPVFDNLEYILGAGSNGEPSQNAKKKLGNTGSGNKKWQELINQGMLNIEPLTYIRGRSIANQYLIVDEAQNLTPHEIKTILTRAGNNTKIVLTGDCFQIDHPYIDSASNGLSYVIERFKDQSIAASVSLIKGERSELAELSANLL